MAAAVPVIMLFSLLLHPWGCNAQDRHALLTKVVEAIEKLVKYYKANFQNMNLDGIFGLKIVEGQIQRMLDEHKQGKYPDLNPRIEDRLHAILQGSIWIGERAIPTVHADDATYFQNLAFIIVQPWAHLKQHKRIKSSLRWEIPVYRSNVDSKLAEAESDKCMMEIGQGKKNNDHCKLTDKCGRIMTKRGFTDYAIVHQLLWTALAEKAGCSVDVGNLLKKMGFNSTEHMQEEFCTNNYYEMLAVVHVFMKGRVKGNYQDIFMEQQFVCPSLGFFEFLKKSYLDQILSWQLPSGCFGVDSEEDFDLEDPHPHKFPPNMDLDKLNTADQVQENDSPNAKNREIRTQLQDVDSSSEVHQFAMLQKLNNEKNGAAGRKDFHSKLLSKNRNNQYSMTGHKPRHRMLVNHVPWPQLNPQLQSKSDLSNKQQYQNTKSGFSSMDSNVVNLLHTNSHQTVKLSRLQINSMHPEDTLNDLNKISGIAPKKLENSAFQQSDAAVTISTRVQVLHQSLGSLPGQQERDKREAAFALTQSVSDISAAAKAWRSKNLLPVAANRGTRNISQKPDKQGHRSAIQRNLLMEKEMPDGCLSHKTGVACAALAMYLRYLIDPGPLDLFAPHDFFPEGSQALGSEESNRKVMNFLQGQMEDNFEDDVGFEDVNDFGQQGDGEEGDEIDEEEEEDNIEEEEEEDEDYDEDEEEMYPETGVVDGQQQERKVVHFGANNDKPLVEDYSDSDKENNDENKDEYADENDDEEEEGADYIKRVKEDEGKLDGKKKNAVDDTEYTYYDDEEEEEEDYDTEPEIINRLGPKAILHNREMVQTHFQQNSHPSLVYNIHSGQVDSTPAKSVVLLLSATSFLLLIFLYRCMRKRRIHVRYCNRNLFQL